MIFVSGFSKFYDNPTGLKTIFRSCEHRLPWDRVDYHEKVHQSTNQSTNQVINQSTKINKQ